MTSRWKCHVKNSPGIQLPSFFTLRLTPTYMFVLMLWMWVLPYMFSGPFWPQAPNGLDPSCQDNWWTNLLYINNVVNLEREVGRCLFIFTWIWCTRETESKIWGAWTIYTTTRLFISMYILHECAMFKVSSSKLVSLPLLSAWGGPGICQMICSSSSSEFLSSTYCTGVSIVVPHCKQELETSYPI